MPPESQVHKQVVRKRAEARAIDIDPATRLHYVEVEEPDMHEPSSDLERVYRALEEQWELDGRHAATSRIMQRLQKALRKGEWKITVRGPLAPARRRRESSPSGPASTTSVFGLAVDVGSTTIAAHLCDLSTGEVAGLRRPDEPADPLRRGSDEPRLLRDDESRRRRAR